MIFDPIYLAILGISMLLSLITAGMVKAQFARGRRVLIASGLRGADVAQRILRDADIHDVTVVEHQGFLSDHYNPMTKTLALSPDVYNGVHAAAAGIAAHEVGHAIQHAAGYKPLWMRSAIVPVANIGSMIGPWLVIAGIMMGAAQGAGLGHGLALTGVLLFGAATLFTLVTVPVEFNASNRAKERLVALGITREGPEAQAVRGVLTAAGLTYVAAAIGSILQLLYWAMQAGLLGGRSSDD
ncbi:MAG: zinc metallopeptidase [Planctomycetes bacterium]|nr:zinc metallopeptidase [Planctomycetota bacterium]